MPPTFGLALGGGGVRGLAHLGALRALERAGLCPDIVAGTSSGAIIGAAFASGVCAAELVDIALGLRWADLVRVSIRRDRVFDTARFEEFLATIIRASDFAQLQVRFGAVARDDSCNARVLLRDGDPRRAAAASSAIRPLFPAVEVAGRPLVDGMGSEPVPASAARELGARYVVAVDVTGRAPARHSADVTIVPDLRRRDGWDFSRAADIIAAGEMAALHALPALEAVLLPLGACSGA